MLFFFQWGKSGVNRGLRLRAVARSSRQDSKPLASTLSRCESLHWVPELTFGSGELQVVIGQEQSSTTGCLSEALRSVLDALAY